MKTANGERNLSFTRDGNSLITRADNRFWQWPLTAVSNILNVEAPQEIISEKLLLEKSAVGKSGFGHLFPTHLNHHFNSAKVRFADQVHPTQLYELDSFPNGVFSVSHTTNWIAMYGPEGLQIRRHSGQPLSIATKYRGGLVLFSPDNRGLAHFSSGILEMFNPGTGQLRWKRAQEMAATMFPTFSNGSRLLAVGGTSSGQVWLIDPVTGDQLATLTPPGNSQVEGLAFSPDDQTLAVSHGRKIVFWNLRSLRQQLAALGLDW